MADQIQRRDGPPPLSRAEQLILDNIKHIADNVKHIVDMLAENRVKLEKLEERIVSVENHLFPEKPRTRPAPSLLPGQIPTPERVCTKAVDTDVNANVNVQGKKHPASLLAEHNHIMYPEAHTRESSENNNVPLGMNGPYKVLDWNQWNQWSY
ncbi:hypothetical protein E0Z10_g1749 [Xylaria hypoxylon]|uniref:Uncharacterized protein n=1 Tax=Xylaria hypoxylon TaxID=37992 RepID=A0A4Z0YRP9_9PEZI|nr:hypothetical protein E0Z10_g1749 [Xylaria hypoxylon]